jgi:hypothetical protein
MYQPTEQALPLHEIMHLLGEACGRIPQQVNGSFIVFYPFVPDRLADVHVLATKLVGLLPSQQIAAHADAPIQGVRYHIPLQVNDGCWSFHDGVWQQLKLGVVYQMDPTKPHGAVNWGETIRLHLMIDVEGA